MVRAIPFIVSTGTPGFYPVRKQNATRTLLLVSHNAWRLSRVRNVPRNYLEYGGNLLFSGAFSNTKYSCAALNSEA